MKQKVRITQGNCKKKIIYYGIDDGGTLKQQLLDSTEELSNCEEDNESVITNSSDAPSDIHNSNFEESSPLTLLVGDVVWSKCSGHNWWPSMIAYEPNSAVYFQTSAKNNNNTPQKYHVQFFGEKALRGWVTKSNIIRFQGLQHFLSITNCNFSSSNQRELWDSAVRGAEEAILFSRKERKLAFLFDYQKKGPSVKKQRSQKKSSASKVKVASAATRRSSRLLVSVHEEGSKPHIVESTCKPHNTHQSSHTSTANVELNTIVEKEEKDPFISHTNKKSSIDSVKVLRSSSVLQDITCVENHLLSDTAPLNIENNCDSGIEDSEIFESSCDDMDLLGSRRKRKPKVFEGFHTGDEITDAFKTKPKVKTDDTKANEEEVDKLDKENYVSLDAVNDISVKTSTCTNQNKNTKSNLNVDENPASDLHDNSDKKVIDDSCAGINGKRKRGYKKCESDETPSASKKTKSLSSVPNGSKKVAYTKVKSCGSSDSNLNGVLSNGEAKDTDDKKDVHDCIKGPPKDNTSNEINKLKRDVKEQFCSMCEEVTGDLLSCSGTCLNQFHPNCLGLNFMPTSDFVCDECTTGCHTCFVCHKVGDIKKCSLNTCGKYYHIECLENNDCTKFENKAKDKFTCPHHVCRYCNKNKSLKMTNGKRMVKCIRCPAAYHLDYCMPAGCMVLTPNHIVCDEHFEPKSSTHLTHINTTWCVVCSFGGALVCCDTCPASFHPDCSEDLDGVPEGAWQCRDCRDGNKLRYGDIVWIKFSIYRWWPGKICLPEDVPVRIQNMPHAVGEFPVLFFGSHDYAWLSSRRVFKYADGDMGLSNTKSYLEKYFLKALQEAKEAFQEIEKKREEHIQAFDKKQSNKPPSYGHAKVNKPVSCIQTILDHSEWPICQCKPDDPCEKECLNKMLFYECNVSQCPNKENCKNQRMQKFQYAETKMFKCEEKGWGLKADQEIKTGQFVIEYVGELIDEATCRIRIKQYHERDIYDYYFLTIDKDNIIDAYPRGNKSRFMNHSCDPNCETQKWTVNGEVRVGLFATRDIIVGEELSFNYNLDCLGNEKKKCKCGSANCSGYLGVRPKTQHSISIAEKLKKSKDGTKEKPKPKKKKKKVKIVHDDECFSCGDGGELLCCDRQNCTKAYHQDCLIMEQAPKGKWQCPWHFCDECGKLARSMCSLCPNSFCESHLDDQMIELMDDVIVCPAHDEEEMANLRKEKVKDSTKTEPVSKSPKSKQKKVPKAPTKKAKDLSLKKVSKVSKKVKKSKTVVSEKQTNGSKSSEKQTNGSKTSEKQTNGSKTSEKQTNGSKTSEPENSESDIPSVPKFTKVVTPAKKTKETKKSPKVTTPGKKSKPSKVKAPEKKTTKSSAAVDKKKNKDGKTALKKVHGSKKTENPDPKKNGIGEKRKHLMKATQKVKDMKRKKKEVDELSENSDLKTSEEVVDDNSVSCKTESIETSILGDTFGDVDIIQRELKKLSNEEKKAAKEQKKVGKAKKRFSFPKT